MEQPMERPSDSKMLDLITTLLARIIYTIDKPSFEDKDELLESLYTILKARGCYPNDDDEKRIR